MKLKHVLSHAFRLINMQAGKRTVKGENIEREKSVYRRVLKLGFFLLFLFILTFLYGAYIFYTKDVYYSRDDNEFHIRKN